MRTLITPEEAYRLAFSEQEGYTPAIITETDIIEAQTRFLTPILGIELQEALIDGYHRDLHDEYVAPTVAAYVRSLIEPLIDLRCSTCRGDAISTAANERVAFSRTVLREKADALRRRLSDYLNNNSDIFEQYNPEDNPLNRCMIYGDIVQIF